MSSTIHAFEKAGLGIAPFRLIRVEMRRFKACPECPSQPGSSCDYCGEGIVETCIIQDVNGKTFKVGNVCVGKTGDRGLINPIKVELARLRRDESHKRDDERIAKAQASLVVDEALRATLSAQPHPNSYRAEKGDTLLDSVNFLISFAGRKGKVDAAKIVEKNLTQKLTPEQVEAALLIREKELSAKAEAARIADELAREVEVARLRTVQVENAWLLDVLTGNGGFVESMKYELKKDTLDRLTLSQRQMDILADIYGKSAGRYNSAKYWEAVGRFWIKAGRDIDGTVVA